MKKNIFYLAALFIASVAFISCSLEDEIVKPQQQSNNKYCLTIEASKGFSTTRALTLDESTTPNSIKATWARSENVYAKKGDDWATGSLYPQDDGVTVQLKGWLSGVTINTDDELILQFPRSGDRDYNGQKGTIADIAANYDYATATVEVASMSNGTSGELTSKAATTIFENQQAIVKFTLKNKATDAALNVQQLTVTVGTNSYTVVPVSATDVLYVAVPGCAGQTVTLTAFDGTDSYTFEKTGVNFVNGNYYTINAKLEKSITDLTIPLTFEAMANDVTISFKKPDVTPSLQYKINNGDWTDFTFSGSTVTTPSLNAGDKVSFKGTNANRLTSDYSSNITCSGDCYVYGNIMSLLDATNYATKTTLPVDKVFKGLFYQNEKIHTHPSIPLALPATTLTANCYEEMFYGCNGLTSSPVVKLPAMTLANTCYKYMFRYCRNMAFAPVLPATTLASSCYYGLFDGCYKLNVAPELPAESVPYMGYYAMFEGCKSLVSAPALPATTINGYSYSAMLWNCTSITEAPSLPATTLADNCYSYMFYGCTSLITPPELPATTLTTACYKDMFYGCSSLETAPNLPATTLTTSCYEEMFYKCNALTKGPDLPAPTLVDQCYKYMFIQCYNMNYLKCLATDISANECTYCWLNDASRFKKGTFIKAPSMTEWPNSISGVPTDHWIIWDDNKFTINNSGGKVYFSSGNLQATYNSYWQGWAFAENQYDYIGNAAGNTSINGNGTMSENGTVDLFGWVGASNTTWTGVAQYGISNSVNSSDYAMSGGLKSDWGNAIGGGWRTLTINEWTYLFNTRTVNGGTGSGKSYTLGQSVNGKLGVVIYPDSYTGSVYTGSDWATFEAAGCVFLPAAGKRSGNSVSDAGTKGHYWSSSSGSYPASANSVEISSSSISYSSSTGCCYGCSVRLVHDAN